MAQYPKEAYNHGSYGNSTDLIDLHDLYDFQDSSEPFDVILTQS
jgi:hypothetical protein